MDLNSLLEYGLNVLGKLYQVKAIPRVKQIMLHFITTQKKKNIKIGLLTVYVDNIILTGDDNAEPESLKTACN